MYLTPEIARIAYQQILAHHIVATGDVMAPRKVTLDRKQLESLFLNTGITATLLEQAEIIVIQKDAQEPRIIHQVAAGRNVSTIREPVSYTATVDMSTLYNIGHAAVPGPGASTSAQWLKPRKSGM